MRDPAAFGHARLVSPAVLATTVYLAIASLLLIRFAAGAVRVARSLRRLDAVTDPSILARFDDIRERSGLRRRVRLKHSPSAWTPWAWGVFRPVIVLPEGFRRIDAASQRNALVHELSHIARLDFVSTWIGCIACALYWWQPLAWLALRRMAGESEHACDDRVLLAGSSGTAYASQLLDIARAIHGRRRQPVFAAAMARSSAVSRRITSILDPDLRRRTMNKTKVCSVSILTMLLLAPLASLKSQEAAAPAYDDPADTGFRARVEEGPANSAELGVIVRTYLANGRDAEAVDAVADYIARSGAAGEVADAQCSFCRSALQSEAKDAGDSDVLTTVRAAVDDVESRARNANDGDLLIRLATVYGADGTGGSPGKGTFYLVEGFRLGNLDDASKLEAIRFLNDLGWYPQAQKLANRLYNDRGSSLYLSPAVETWIRRFDIEMAQRNSISERLLTPGASFIYADDIVPVYRKPPEYPPDAIRQGREGSVQLGYTIDARGRTKDIVVISSTDPRFIDTAVASLSEWLYLPQVVDGGAVEKTGVKTVIRFVLN